MSQPWEVLEVVGTEEEAELIVGYLTTRDVPCAIESMHSHEFPVNVTKLGEVRLEVPSEHLPRARELLAELQNANVDDSSWEDGSLLEDAPTE